MGENPLDMYISIALYVEYDMKKTDTLVDIHFEIQGFLLFLFQGIPREWRWYVNSRKTTNPRKKYVPPSYKEKTFPISNTYAFFVKYFKAPFRQKIH